MTALRRNRMSEAILGVDIAKRKFDVALLINGKLKHKVFTNNQEGFEELELWLKKHGANHVHVCLEASSTYGDELAIYMYDAGHTVSIVNPARIKGFAQSELMRTKNDKVDAGLIARFCLAMHPEPWTPAPPEMRQLQALVRRVDALINMRTQELHRLGTAQATIEDSIRNISPIWIDRSIASNNRLPIVSRTTRTSRQRGTSLNRFRGSAKQRLPPSLRNSLCLRGVTGYKRLLPS